MTEKELRRLNRKELLQLLIGQMEENQILQEQLKDSVSRLQERQIMVEKAGSLAEASLLLNGVFQAAEDSASQYLENIRRMKEEQEVFCRKLYANAEAKASEIIKEAQEYSEKKHAEADEYWKRVNDRTKALLRDQNIVEEWISSRERKQNDQIVHIS